MTEETAVRLPNVVVGALTGVIVFAVTEQFFGESVWQHHAAQENPSETASARADGLSTPGNPQASTSSRNS